MLAVLIAGFGVVALAVWTIFAIELALGSRRVVDLRSVETQSGAPALPPVSVVIAARDEERAIEAALASVLALDYPRLEVVVVDDRSQDGTRAILARLARGDLRLRLIRIDELPRGWLGKNHALQRGAEAASGEFLLFTDADVDFEPSALARAMRVVRARGLDHLTAACEVRTPGLALELFVATFALFFNAYLRPWRAGDPASRAAVGIGAFNLVRAAAYRAAGGHEALRLAADDDLRLGIRLKQSGARALFAAAGRLISVEWYPSLQAAVRGLEKNSLAVVGYSTWRLVAGCAAQVSLSAWPFVAVWLTVGWVRLAYAGAVALIVGCHLFLIRSTGLRPWTAAALPVGVLLVVFAVLRAALLARLRGGVTWRGTWYSLEELRRGAPTAGG